MIREGIPLAPGAGLLLCTALPGVPADVYILLAFAGETALLSRAGVNEDGGLCTTWRRVSVPIADLCHFIPTGWTVHGVGEE